MTLAERKKAELTRKLANLEADFRYWEELSAHALEKHYTQVRAVLLPLRVLHKRIEDDLNEKSGDELLGVSRKATQLILGVHRIWEFFRPKFAQRLDPAYTAFLEIADEFAWLCYQSVPTPNKRPPLVFLNSGDSPFVLRRESRYEAGPARESMEDASFKEVLDKLPFPVIGVPWHEIEYLPEMVVIGHEVGHAVERDLNLTKRLDEAVKACLKEKDRAIYWNNWQGELFADAYGCLATGPAFAAGLADFVASSPEKLKAGAPALRGYPPTLLRIEFNMQVLMQAGCATSIPGWDEAYPFPAGLDDFRPEAAAIARALVGTDGPLAGLITFTGDDWTTASGFAKSIVQGRRWEGAPIKNLRVLVAAMRRAYELDPPAFWIKRVGAAHSPIEKLLMEMRSIVRPERRSGPEMAAPTFDTADKELGQTWYSSLSKGAEATGD